MWEGLVFGMRVWIGYVCVGGWVGVGSRVWVSDWVGWVRFWGVGEWVGKGVCGCGWMEQGGAEPWCASSDLCLSCLVRK